MTDDQSLPGRRRFLAVAAAAVGLAGCTGGSGGGVDTEDDGDGEGDDEVATDTATETATATATSTPTEPAEDTPTETPTQPSATTVPGADEYESEERGSVAENTVDELAVLGWTAEVRETFSSDEPQFFVTVTVKNLGAEATDLFDYNYVLRHFDDGGTKLADARAVQVNVGGGTTAEPGDTAQLGLYLDEAVDPEAVARYEIVVNCRFSNGEYC